MGELQLSELFLVKKDVELPGRVVTVTALGELAVRDRERLARLASSRYRKKLRDTSSEEYELNIEPLSELNDTQLKDYLEMCYEQLVAQDEARLQVKNTFVPEPDNADLDEKIDAIEAQAEADKATSDKFDEIVKALKKEYRDGIEDWPTDKLLAEAKIQAVSFFALSEFLRNFLLASVYLASTYQGKKLFPNMEAADNAPRDIINTLYSAFQEVNQKDGWAISKAALRGESTASVSSR